MPSFNANDILQLLRQVCDKTGVPMNRQGLKQVSTAMQQKDGSIMLSQRYLDEYILKQAQHKSTMGQPVKLNSTYVDALAHYAGFNNYHHFCLSAQKPSSTHQLQLPRVLNSLPGPTLRQLGVYEKHMLVLYELIVSQRASIVIKHQNFSAAIRFIRHLIHFFRHHLRTSFGSMATNHPTMNCLMTTF